MEISMLERDLKEDKVPFMNDMELEFHMYIILEVLGLGLSP
jgi:hypothetical protein